MLASMSARLAHPWSRFALGLVLAASSVPVGSSRAMAPARAPCPVMPECASCRLYCRFVEALAEARLDVGTLPAGIVIHLSADDPEVVEGLRRYAYARRDLRAMSDALLAWCSGCRARRQAMAAATYTLAESVHGVFTLVTSTDAGVVEALHDIAAELVLEGDLRGT